MSADIRFLPRFIAAHLRWSLVVLLVLVLGFVAVFRAANSQDDSRGETSEVEPVPQVRLASVAALSAEEETLSFVGEVRAQNEAELRAETTGEIRRVNVSAGQFVSAGAVLAEFEADAERAGLTSAEGALAAAEAALQKAQSGPRSEQREIDALEEADARASLAEAKQSAVNTLQEAFTDAQDAVLSRADDFFRKARTYRPYLIPSSATLAQSKELEAERVELLTLFTQWDADLRGLSANDELEGRLTQTQERLQFIKQFLELLQNVVSDQETRDDLTQSDIDAQEASIDTALATINGAIDEMIAARSSLTNKRAALAIAEQRNEETQRGERPEDIAAAQAQVLQAQGGLQSARAAFERKRVRAPLSGTVSTLSVEQGDFVQSGDLLARVVNDSAREVELSVSQRALARIARGDSATVAGRYAARVTSIEPGLSPAGRQATVKIGLVEAAEELTIGDVVSVTIEDSDQARGASEDLMIPVTALKILPTRTVVFVVTRESTLAAREVTPGTITGERVIIRDGLSPDDVIVIDARGLSEGERVTVETDA